MKGESLQSSVFVSAIVLAAGMANRMGRQKLLLPVDGRPMVLHAVDAALGSGVRETIVVVGHEAAAVREVVGHRPVTIVQNDHYADGMSSSLQAGIEAVDPACDAAVVLLGDQPFVPSTLLDRLIERFVVDGAAAVRPVIDGHPVNPVLISVRLFPELRDQQGDIGGREVVERHADELSLVLLDDVRIGVDVDSPADYEDWRKTS